MQDAIRRCLVTGASGFVGSHALQALRRQGHQVAIAGRTAGVDEHVDLTADTVRLVGTYDWVFHFAGHAHVVPRNDLEASRFERVNAEGTAHLLNALTHQATRPLGFVLASTVAVYGMEAGQLLPEQTTRAAMDPYGRSKIAAEDSVTRWGDRLGVKTAILRLPLVAGRDAPGNLGKMVGAIRRGRYLRIGDGSARRSMVLAEDVGSILSRAADTGGTFNLTDGQHPSFAELDQRIADALNVQRPRGIPMAVASLLAKCGDVLRSTTGRSPFDSRTLGKMTSTLTFDDSHARQALGWQPRRVVDELAGLLR